MKFSCGCELKFRVGSGVCSFCRRRRGRHNPRRISRSSFKSRMPECQSGDAGASPADRTNFQIPIIETHNVCGGRQLAQQSLQNSAGSGQHRDAVPLFQSRGSQVGRQRPHKPSMSGFDSRPRHQFSLGRSIIQEVTRLASGRARCKAVAVHHFKSREG